MGWILPLLMGTAFAADAAKLEEVHIDYKNFHQSARHPLFYRSTPKESLNLSVQSSLLNVIGWDSTVQSMTNSAQYYMVGLQMRFYLRVSRSVEVGYYHQSQHVLDDTYPHKKFPVEDAFTVKLYLYRGDNPTRGTIF